MKIKTKKQLNLPQLIEWAWKNGIKGKVFYTHKTRMKNVYFNTLGRAEFSDVHQFSEDDYFTVEVEEEITEDTEFDELVGLDEDGGYWKYDNTCVDDFNLSRIKAVYILNDDLTMTLIWRDGKLVE